MKSWILILTIIINGPLAIGKTGAGSSGGGGRESAKLAIKSALNDFEDEQMVEDFKKSWVEGNLSFALEAKLLGIEVLENQVFPCFGYNYRTALIGGNDRLITSGCEKRVLFPSDIKVIPTDKPLYIENDSEEKYAISYPKSREIWLNVNQWKEIQKLEADLKQTYAMHEYFVIEGLENNRDYTYSAELSRRSSHQFDRRQSLLNAEKVKAVVNFFQ